MGKKTFLNFSYYDFGNFLVRRFCFFFVVGSGVRDAGEPATMIKVDYFAQEQDIEHLSPTTLPEDPLDFVCQKICSSVLGK